MEELITGRPLSNHKLVLACPTYGAVDPICQKHLRTAIMFSARYGVDWLADSSPDRIGWGAARNISTEQALSIEEMTGMMWIDSDIRQRPSDIATLLMSVDQFKLDFVTGIYHQRQPPYKPIIYQFDRKIRKYRICDEMPKLAIAPIDGCGFGFVYTSRQMLEAIKESKNFNPDSGWFPDTRDAGGYGEDLGFCKLAEQAGFRLHANTGVQVGHVGDPYVITEETRKQYKAIVGAEERAKDKRWGE